MKRTIPRTIPTLSNQSNGQQQAPPLKSRTRVLGLVSPQLSSQASKVTPYQSSDHAQEVLLDYEIQSIDRQLAEAVSEREQKHEQAKGLEEYPPRDTPANIGVAALGAGLVGLAFFSWLNSGQYVAMNFTDTFGQALLFCSVIPVIPFAMKYFINGMLGSQRRCVELILAGLFLVSSAVFADQFAQLFAKKEGITITAPAFDFGGNDSGEAPTPPAEDPYAPVSLRGFFFGSNGLAPMRSSVGSSDRSRCIAIRAWLRARLRSCN